MEELLLSVMLLTAEPFYLILVFSRLKLLLQNYKKYNSPGSNQIPAELVQAGDKTLLPEIHKTKTISSSSSVVLSRLHVPPLQTHCFSENLVAP
jgi:hypothetical protein